MFTVQGLGLILKSCMTLVYLNARNPKVGVSRVMQALRKGKWARTGCVGV